MKHNAQRETPTRKVGSRDAATSSGRSDIGRRFKDIARRNGEAREKALASIVQRPNGWWQATVGGPVRGRVVTAGRREQVEALVHRHYGRAIHERTMALAREM